jgi:probable rRNA maturation factor
MELNLFFEDVEIPELKPEFFVSWFLRVVQNENKELGDVNLIFCSDEYLLSINQEHLNHDYYTDIITFDYSIENTVSGDLFISYDRVKDNAETLKTDTQTELYRVCVHGLLHLCGYKDKSEEDEAIMRSKEDEALRLIID